MDRGCNYNIKGKSSKWKDLSGEAVEYLRHNGDKPVQSLAEREISRREELEAKL